MKRNVALQLMLALVGTVANCVFAQSWKDLPHLIYDIPASLAVFAFIAQVVVERPGPSQRKYWLGRLILIVILTVVCTGREFLKWTISGHLTCVLAVALVQTGDPRLRIGERLLYWVPLPIVLAIRWSLFDCGGHGETYHAALAAVLVAVPVIILARLFAADPAVPGHDSGT